MCLGNIIFVYIYKLVYKCNIHNIFQKKKLRFDAITNYICRIWIT